MHKFDQEKFWAGSSASFFAVIDAQERAVEYLASSEAKARSDVKAWVDEMVGPVYTPEGSVGVINIKGSLVNGEAGVMRLYGALGYDEIRQALTEAVADKNVRSILLKIDSGGGQVAGVEELGKYIMEVAKVKPVTSFTDTVMASAAYWLGCCADTIMAGNTATVGSIGVLIVHQEVSKMMADSGVTTTIVRSGKYKALVNRFEPLSDLAKEELQAQVDDLDATFIAHVADRRGTSPEVARRKMGQGREFLGARAVDAGLVDSLSTFSEAHAAADGSTASKAPNARKPVASRQTASNNGANDPQGTRMKINLTPEQLAALAGGAPLASLGLTDEQLQAATAAESQAKAEAEAKKKADEAAAAAGNTTEPAANAGNDNVVQFLRNELRDANASLAQANVELVQAKAALEPLKAENQALLAIARGSLGNMQVALGGTNTAETVADKDVAAEHARVAEAFTKRFPVGRTSAAVTEPHADNHVAGPNETMVAVLRMARGQA